MPAPRHVASKVFVDNSGRDNAWWMVGIIRNLSPVWMVLQCRVWLYYHEVSVDQ
jgi:hypothetical protein